MKEELVVTAERELVEKKELLHRESHRGRVRKDLATKNPFCRGEDEALVGGGKRLNSLKKEGETDKGYEAEKRFLKKLDTTRLVVELDWKEKE